MATEKKATLVTCPGCRQKTATFKLVRNKDNSLLANFNCPKCGGHQFRVGGQRWKELELKDKYILDEVKKFALKEADKKSEE